MVVLLLLLSTSLVAASDAEENRTDTGPDEAEFRQGGIAQQLMAAGSAGGLYPGLQYAAAPSGSGYVNMLRNLYRPQSAPSFGLTDKVKHWVKSFMNRRQYVKPYYGTAAGQLQYSPDEFGGKPVFIGGGGATGYKAISVPLRQLQKYYKPYYGEGNAQFQQQVAGGGAAGSSSVLSYSPYALQSPGTAGGMFAGTDTSGLFSSQGEGGSASALFSAAGLYGAGGSDGQALYQAASGGNNSPYGTLEGASLYGSDSGSASSSAFLGSGGSSGSSYLGSGGNGGSSYLGSGGNGGSSYLGSAGNGGSSYLGSAGNGGSSSSYFGSPSGNGGSRAILQSSLGGSGVYAGGDLYASGASPPATLFNPNQEQRGYGGKKMSSSALYLSSQGMNSAADSSYAAGKELASSYSSGSSGQSDSPRSGQSSYSVAFQPSSGGTQSNSGFQPVSFGASDFQGKSS